MEILLVEDHRLVADAMLVMFKQTMPTANITVCYSAQNALALVDSGKKFDLVLADLLMPGIDGIELLIGLKNRDKKLPVVIVTASEADGHIQSALENGASGFITKTMPATEMLAALKIVLGGGTFYPEQQGRLTSSDFLSNEENLATPELPEIKLGKKQLNVLQLLADGNSNKQISQIVGITEATVKYHTSQLFKQLNVKNRTSCVREAQRHGLITSFDELAEN